MVTAILTLSYLVALTGAFSVHILNLTRIDMTSNQEIVRCSMSTSNPSLFYDFFLVHLSDYMFLWVLSLRSQVLNIPAFSHGIWRIAMDEISCLVRNTYHGLDLHRHDSRLRCLMFTSRY